MNKFDIILTQNTADVGLEFEEQIVNLSKGDILTAGSDGFPLVHNHGSNGKAIIYDSTTPTGLNEAAIDAVWDKDYNDLINKPDLADLQDDSDHRTVSDAEKITWNAKAAIGDIPTDINQLTDASDLLQYLVLMTDYLPPYDINTAIPWITHTPYILAQLVYFDYPTYRSYFICDTPHTSDGVDPINLDSGYWNEIMRYGSGSGITTIGSDTLTDLNGLLLGNGTTIGIAIPDVDYVETETDPLSIHLDQSTEQEVTGGRVKFGQGITFASDYVVDEAETEGDTYYDTANHTISTVLENGVILQHGQEIHVYGKNISGAIIYNGDPVSVVASNGQYTAFSTVDITTPSAYAFIGLATHEIGIGDFGYVTKIGVVRDINTDSFTEGKPVYIAHDGTLTKEYPTPPDYVINVGVVDYKHHSHGRINVIPLIVPRLSDLSDIDGTPLSESGQIPVYIAGSDYFDFNYNINDYALASSVPTDINELTDGSDLLISLPTTTSIMKGDGAGGAVAAAYPDYQDAIDLIEIGSIDWLTDTDYHVGDKRLNSEGYYDFYIECKTDHHSSGPSFRDVDAENWRIIYVLPTDLTLFNDNTNILTTLPYAPALGADDHYITSAERVEWNEKLDGAELGTVNQVLHGNPSGGLTFSAVLEEDILLTPGSSVNNTVVGTHGFAPALSGVTTQFLRGDGAWATPATVTVPNAYAEESFAYSANVAHNIVHNFGARPLVQCLTSTGDVIIPLTINHVDNDTVAITFDDAATYDVVLTLGSPPLTAYVSTSANYNMLADDTLIEVTAADKLITLLTPVGREGKQVTIKNSSTGVCDVQSAAGLLEGVADVTIPSTNAFTFCSNGVNWILI